jgi:hypothetical protein
MLFLNFSVWYVFCLFIILNEKARPKTSHFIASVDLNHRNLLPRPIGKREGSRPSLKLPFYSWVYSIKPFSHLPSKDILFKSKIFLFISPH